MLKRIICCIISVIMLMPAAAAAEKMHDKPQMQSMYSEQADLNYWLTTPSGYNTDENNQSPLLLYLHGAGERGSDLEALKKNGIPKVYDKIADFPFVTVSPLCPENTYWDTMTGSLNILIDEIIERYNIDTDRVYITGLSMGGYGTWEMAMCYPEKFAAILPLAGGGDPYQIENIKDIPVWTFHGRKDGTVPIEANQVMVDSLKAVGGNVKFTIYEDASHDIWDITYDNPEIYKWLLEHKRSGKVQPAPKDIPEVVELNLGKVAYARAFGNGCEEQAFDAVMQYAFENGLNQSANTKYFGFTIDADISGSMRGYEAWVNVDDNAKETEQIKIKSVPTGTYAVLNAKSDEDIDRTWKNQWTWLRTSVYRQGINYDMNAVSLTDNKMQFSTYLSILPKSNTRDFVMDSFSEGYSENGNWRPYSYIRTGATMGRQGEYAQWSPIGIQEGYYKISILKPVNVNSDSKAHIEVNHYYGSDSQYIDFTDGIVEWVELGIYFMKDMDKRNVRVYANSQDAFARASALKFEFIAEDIDRPYDINGSWAQQTVIELVYKGIVTGFDDNTFQPDATVAYDQFIKLVVSAMGYHFPIEQEGYWAMPYINKAKDLGLIGENEIDEFDQPISRILMARALANAVRHSGQTYTNVSLLIAFSDTDNLPEADVEALQTVTSAGLILGFEDETFRPLEHMTRAQCSEVIMRLMNPNKRKSYTTYIEPKPITNDEDGTIIIPAERANIDNTKTIRIDESSSLSYWYTDESASWTIDVQDAGEYKVEITYSAPDIDVGAEIILECEGDTLKYDLNKGTGKWGDFDDLEIGTINLTEGSVKLTMKHGKLTYGTFMNLKQMKLTPVKQ